MNKKYNIERELISLKDRCALLEAELAKAVDIPVQQKLDEVEAELETVKADNANLRTVVQDMIAAMHQYQMDVDCPAPRDHVSLMNRAESILLTHSKDGDTEKPCSKSANERQV